MPDLSLQQTAEDGHALLLLKQSEYWPALERLLAQMLEARFQDVLNADMSRIQHERGRYFGVKDVEVGIERRISDALRARDHLRATR